MHEQLADWTLQRCPLSAVQDTKYGLKQFHGDARPFQGDMRLHVKHMHMLTHSSCRSVL